MKKVLLILPILAALGFVAFADAASAAVKNPASVVTAGDHNRMGRHRMMRRHHMRHHRRHHRM
ncbi:hypothetical protein [Methylobacterium crusticola]|uniref:hypothetical protein n=1 Tax=Methylobacterium crusticola TaxID=1697972 RepID=UPI000FFC811B|nr:hypothetical protein [Methylobacterium crusticola]